MPTKEAMSASTAHMIAVLCMQLVKEDETLIAAVQQLGHKAGVPFDADKISAMVIEMSEAAVTIVGQRLLKHEGPVSEFEIPVPQVEDGLERSAGALAVGSMTTEFVHSDAERFAAFVEWLNARHPGSVEKGAEVKRATVEDADQMLTLMAHVTSELIRAGAVSG